MEQIALSIEQMQHLEELGLDTSDASMMWVTGFGYPSKICSTAVKYTRLVPNSGEYYGLEDDDYTPTYTLTDILNKLPKNIPTDFKNPVWVDKSCRLIILVGEDSSIVVYEYQVEVDEGVFSWDYYMFTQDKSLLEAAYQMLVWCIENGYIKTNKVWKQKS